MSSQQQWFTGASHRLVDVAEGPTHCVQQADVSTGIFIAVPEDIAPLILREGYQCSRRRRVPANRDRHAAIRAYHRGQHSQPAALFEVVRLPPGVAITQHKDGIKLETGHLPASCLVRVFSLQPSSEDISRHMFHDPPDTKCC